MQIVTCKKNTINYVESLKKSKKVVIESEKEWGFLYVTLVHSVLSGDQTIFIAKSFSYLILKLDILYKYIYEKCH
jgi:hypothetical protein